MIQSRIRENLEELAEEKYASFSMSLIPNCKELMLGVRIPILRKIAKQIIKEGQGLAYLELRGELSFEEKMLKMLIFGNLKLDIDSKLALVPDMLAEITNWSLCDSFCNEFKDVALHKQRVWEFLKAYYFSKNTYELRVLLVLILVYFVEEAYLADIFAIFNSIKSEDYYVKMAIAWGVSICFVKFEAETMQFLQGNNLDDFTHNKSLQKIRESLRVSSLSKGKIKTLKRG